jgi:C4-dicarboxylate-specific signal transduction histidine kinase
MNISAKIWLSISALLLGYLITVTVNAMLGLYAEQRLNEIATTLFPATTATREAEIAFTAQVQAYEGAVLTGDQDQIPLAAKHADTVTVALDRVLATVGLRDDRHDALSRLRVVHATFTSSAQGTYQTLAMGKTSPALQVEAAKLNGQAGHLQTQFKEQVAAFTGDLKQELSATVARSIQQRQVSLVVLIIAVGISLTLVYVVISRWTGRLTELMQASARLARGDFSVALGRHGRDEIGRLADSFVAMQEAISVRNEDLRRFNESLEQTIRQRTRELSERNEELVHEIEERKRAQAEVQELHNQLLDASRRAGMAEVATGVLHNVGNVLNSVNVSTNLIRDQLREAKAGGLTKAAELMLAQGEALGRFMQDDARGRQLPGYLAKLAEHLIAQQRTLSEETARLAGNIEHIKEIIQVQQSYGKAVGVIQQLRPQDVMDEALRLNVASLQRHTVEIERHFADLPAMPIDRHKVLQILVNLISNAKHAIEELDPPRRLIVVRIERTEDNALRFTVQDNGIGIPEANLKSIFNHGFTTKKDGHGFGLHSCANAAKEMKGTLTVSSPGPGQGATFVFTMPISDMPTAVNV